MISFAGLTYSYSGKSAFALQQVNLDITEGSIFALLGPNGAGKTTLLRILCGRLSGYQGSLHIPQEWANLSGILDPRHYGVLIENPGIYGRLSVSEYLGFFASFYAISDAKSRIAALAERFSLENLSQRMNTLSLGMRQKVQVMRVFLHRPPLILLDEPSSNLDPLARDEVWNLVRETNQHEGTTFIICSHLLAEMECNATHIGLLKKGNLLASGSLGEVRTRFSDKSEVSIHFTTEFGVTINIPKLLTEILPVNSNIRLDANTLRYCCTDPKMINPKVIASLVEQGMLLSEVSVEKDDLGAIYRKLVTQ